MFDFAINDLSLGISARKIRRLSSSDFFCFKYLERISKMSNLIQYIIQEDPEEERRRQEERDKGSILMSNKSSENKPEQAYKYSPNNLLENDFSSKSTEPKPTNLLLAGLKDKQDPNGTTPTKSSSSGLGLGSANQPSPSTQLAETNPPSHNASQMSSSSTNSSAEDLMSRMTPVLYQMEEPKNHIYIDTTWNKTSGIGANVNDWNTFKNINWKINGKSASEAEKRTAFDVYQKEIDTGLQNKDINGNVIKNNKKADAYKNYSQLRLNNEEMDKLLKQHLQEDIKYLQTEFENFDSFPSELQNVLLDIKFNTGNVSTKKWPKLRKAIADKNLFGDEGILKNVHRKDVDLKRNKWSEQQIRNIKSW